MKFNFKLDKVSRSNLAGVRTSKHDCHSSCKMNTDPEKAGGEEQRIDFMSQWIDPAISCSMVTENDELHQIQMRWFHNGISLKENGFH